MPIWLTLSIIANLINVPKTALGLGMTKNVLI